MAHKIHNIHNDAHYVCEISNTRMLIVKTLKIPHASLQKPNKLYY